MEAAEFERYILIGVGIYATLLFTYLTIRYRIRKRKFHEASQQWHQEMQQQGKTVTWDHYHKWAREWSAEYPPAPKFMMRISRMIHGNPF